VRAVSYPPLSGEVPTRQQRPIGDHSIVGVSKRTAPGGFRATEWIWLAADVILLLLAAFVIGAIISWVRFRTAQLPPFSATSDLGIWRVFLTGLGWLGAMLVAFAVLGVLAYRVAGRDRQIVVDAAVALVVMPRSLSRVCMLWRRVS